MPNQNRKKLEGQLTRTLSEADWAPIDDLIGGASRIKGKVRDMLEFEDRMLILTSDRISAFDRVLTTIPCKGEILNRISLYWFEKTSQIIDNHVLEQPSPRSQLVKKCQVLPLEVVVRGYLTGSAWRAYQRGEEIPGIPLMEGLRYNERFPQPLITPSTKEERGHHDKPISREEILENQIVTEPLWMQIEKTALELFHLGSELLEKRGLILVDTKYEFGLSEGKLLLVDEIHTPDSSRFWYADTYEDLFSKGENQRELDKEYLRRWLLERGYSGDGEAPVIPDEVRLEMAERYIRAFEELTGEDFQPSELDVAEEMQKIGEALSRVSR
jgi:phosphoribosylaminoimidazole-succinocarboxamide synthase